MVSVMSSPARLNRALALQSVEDLAEIDWLADTDILNLRADDEDLGDEMAYENLRGWDMPDEEEMAVFGGTPKRNSQRASPAWSNSSAPLQMRSTPPFGIISPLKKRRLDDFAEAEGEADTSGPMSKAPAASLPSDTSRASSAPTLPPAGLSAGGSRGSSPHPVV